jgi:GxxExxY protein
MIENELTQLVIGYCIDIHRELGPGLYEIVYEEALKTELIEAGIAFTCQQPIDVNYKGRSLGLGFKADFIIDNKLIIELKSIETLAPVHKKQLITYLKLTEIKLGLLINFNVDVLKNGIVRIANGM